MIPESLSKHLQATLATFLKGELLQHPVSPIRELKTCLYKIILKPMSQNHEVVSAEDTTLTDAKDLRTTRTHLSVEFN